MEATVRCSVFHKALRAPERHIFMYHLAENVYVCGPWKYTTTLPVYLIPDPRLQQIWKKYHPRTSISTPPSIRYCILLKNTVYYSKTSNSEPRKPWSSKFAASSYSRHCQTPTRKKNAPFTCNVICKTTLKSTHQIHGNTIISTNSKNAGIKVCREYDVLQ